MVWVVVVGLSFSLLGGCASTRSMAARAVGWIPWIHERPQAAAALAPSVAVRTRKLEMTLQLTPFPVKLSETRRLVATLRLKNISPHFVQLEFPTSQRFDVTLKDAKGRLVAQWSEDQAYEPVPGYIRINPGEQVEFLAALATRDLQAAKPYTLTAFLPDQKDLTAELTLVPER